MAAERRRGSRGAGLVVSVGCVVAALLALCLLVGGAPASPHGFRYQQPDGSRTPLLFIHGDETYHYVSDADGFTVIRDEDSGGWYVYAKRASDHDGLVSSGGRVGFVKPEKLGLEPGLRPPESARRPEVSFLSEGSLHSESIRRRLRFSGVPGSPYVLKTLVVLMRFSDHVDRDLPSHSDIEILFNEAGGHPDLAPSGSVRDVWLKNSHGRFDVEATVTQWIDLPNTEAYYANNNWGWQDEVTRQAFYFAMKHIDENTDINLQDFSQDDDNILDSVCFVHSGIASEFGATDCETGNGEQQRIWSHRSGGSWTAGPGNGGVRLSGYFVASAIWPVSWTPPCTFDIGRVGVFAHESGHHIGLPDLYDTGGGGKGVGNFDFMGNMWGWDGTLHNPPHLSPWSKMFLNWVSTVVLDREQEYELIPSIDIDEAYVINHNFPGNEYLIVENRFAKEYDAAIPGGGGLAVYHIDLKAGHDAEGFPGQAGWPGNGRHYQNALLSADGNYDLEHENGEGDATDLFRAGVAGVASAIGPNGINIGKAHPNTDSYQGGNIQSTGISITDISQPGERMTFRLSGDGLLTGAATSGNSGDGGGSDNDNHNDDNTAHDAVQNRGEIQTQSCEDNDGYKKKGKAVCAQARKKLKKKSVAKVCKKSFVKDNCKRSCEVC